MKDTISDISHQLKTPLAALTMYQEIIESEPENAETVKQFAAKMGISLKRMEQLILSMLKITRLDTGNIILRKSCRVSELIAHSVNDLTTRAKSESKQIQIDGDGEQQLICDMEWTGEAIGNIVKMHWITRKLAVLSVLHGSALLLCFGFLFLIMVTA